VNVAEGPSADLVNRANANSNSYSLGGLGNDDVVQRLAVVSRCGRHRGRISPGSAQTKVSRRYLGVADGAVASLSSYAGSVILVREVESARVVVRLDQSCRPCVILGTSRRWSIPIHSTLKL